MNLENGVTSIADQIIDAIKSAIDKSNAPLHEPSFQGNELTYLKECIDSTYVSSVGKFVDQFEKGLIEFTGAKHAVAVVNGTAALHIALKIAGIGKDDEVLMPALTFAATANAIRYCNAIPHFIDSEEDTLGVNIEKLRNYLIEITEIRQGITVNKKTGRPIKAIVPMHTFGHPVKLDGLLSVANDFKLTIIEDAAESLGSFYKGRHTGTFGLLGTLSFNGNKTITTGGGGAILTNNPYLANYAKHITTTAKLPHPWEYRHDEVGFNYRLPNLNAALGCAQLEQLPKFLLSKRKLFEKYKKTFSSISLIKLLKEPECCTSNYWLQTILLDEKISTQRDSILAASNNAGIMTRPAWILINELPHFSRFPKMDLSCAQSLSRRIINIPSSANLIVTT